MTSVVPPVSRAIARPPSNLPRRVPFGTPTTHRRFTPSRRFALPPPSSMARISPPSSLAAAALVAAVATVLVLVRPITPFAAADDASPGQLLQRGNDMYGAGRLREAADAYESCLAAASDSPSSNRGSSEEARYCAINLASVLVDMSDGGGGGGGGDGVEELERAEGLYRAALEVDPDDGDTSFNLALLLQDRKTDAATREAARLYRVAVAADPDRWDAWANLAAALSEIGEFPLQAIEAYERSILLIERMAEEGGEGDNPERDAYLSKLYYGYGTGLSELGAEACGELAASPQSLLIGAGDDGSAASASAATSAEVCAENARNAMRTAVILDATNVQASHMLAAMTASDGDGDAGADGVHRRAAPEFVAALFDDFADTFDEKLGALEYRVPGIVGAAAAAARPGAQQGGGPPFESALDAGCGTGLAGRYLRPLVSGPMVGVDISKKMLDVARLCTTGRGCGAGEDDGGEGGSGATPGQGEDEPLYDGLVALDLEAMTLEETLLAPGVIRREGDHRPDGFDLVVAADVLVYFGRLDAVLANFAALSRPGAVLLFSCERADAEEAPLGWRLLSSGRFAHTRKYVVGAAEKAGYDPVGYEEIVPRMERGLDVRGHLFHLVLRGGGGGDDNDDDPVGRGTDEL